MGFAHHTAMQYLFGDSTPFPLVENFLVTLCAVTDACVAILQAAELADARGQRLKQADDKVHQALSQLAELARRVEDGFGAHPELAGPGDTPSDRAMTRICEFAWETIKETRAEILSWRDEAAGDVSSDTPRAQVLQALSTLLVVHQMPETAWSLRWSAGLSGQASSAEAFARTPFGLEATFDVDVPANHPWSRPVKVSLLEKDVTLHMTRKPWFGKPRPYPESLDKLFLTSVTHTPDDAAMRLSKSAKEPSSGIEIVVRNATSENVTATRIGPDGNPCDTVEVLSPEDVATVYRFWERIENTICELVCHRRRLTTATLGGIKIGEIGQPETVAGAFIQAIAPLVREIALRTSTPSELALKRHLGDGRREELFISYDTVLGRIAELSERHQTMFDAFGLRKARSTKGAVRQLTTSRHPSHLRVVNGGAS